MKSHLQRAGAVLFSLIFIFSFCAAPLPARAGLLPQTVIEIGPTNVLHQLITSVKTTATAIFTGATAASTGSLAIKEYALDPLAYMIAKIALQSVTKSVVNWINSGFHGSPAFVTNLNSALLKVSDTYASQFLGQLASNSSISSPFQSAISQAVRTTYYQSTASDGFFLRNPYTLNQTTSNDAAFLGGDFTQGGWNAWLSTMRNPANNPNGAQLLQEEALGNVVGGAIDNQKQQWQWSGGFNSWRGSNCPTSGSGSGGTTLQYPGGPPIGLPGGTTDGTGTGGGTQTPGGPPIGLPDGSTLNAPASLTNTDPCLFNPIQTPGTAIAAALNKAVGSGQDQLVTADEINEIVGALMGQLVNQVLGPGGLTGVSQPSAGGGSSYITQAADPNQYNASGSAASGGSLSASFLTTLGNQATQLQLFQSNWQKIDAAASTTKDALTNTTCVTNAATIITTQVEPIITKAATAIANATASLASLNNIKTQLIAADSSGATSDQTAAVAQATSAYQTLLASPTLPTSDDLKYAQDQSDDTGSSTPASLYSQLQDLTAQAQCLAPTP